MMKTKQKTAKRQNKKNALRIKIIALALAVILVAGGVLAFVFTRPETIQIAARTDIIKHWNEQGITNYFEAELGLRVKWIDYGTDTYTRLQEDLGKEPKDLPDAYLGMGLDSRQLEALVAQSSFLELSDSYVNAYAPNLRDIINADTSRRDEMLFQGKLYSLPSLNEQYAEEYPQKAWINNDWLVRAKLEMPDSPQELLEVLRVFKTSDLNGNGKQDEVPLGAAYKDTANGSTFGFLISAFVTTDFDLTATNYINVGGDGKLYAGSVQPGFKDALAYLNTIYRENLVDATVFEQSTSVFLNGSKAQEKYGVILAKDLGAIMNDTERASNYLPLAPLKNGEQSSTFVKRTAIKTGGFLIPNRIDEERQILALKFGDAMLSQGGTLTVCYGNENVGWFAADNSTLAMGAQRSTWRLAPQAVDGTLIYSGLLGEVPYWLSAGRQMERQATAPTNGALPSLQTKENWAGYMNKVTKEYYEPVGLLNLQNALPELTPSAQEELDYSGVIDAMTEGARAFVTGKRDLATQWDAYIAELNERGLNDILEAIQRAYDQSVTE
ncbi:MAG: hypothetical protein LBB67_02615 [Oscillospiraceae bacterium]|jgi:putative aldouronate transport system substrate-binding protein|nr:hypothetical protein [Oscillospiraceae bacterium]